MNLKMWNLQLHTLTIFSSLKKDPVFKLLMKTIGSDPKDVEDFIEKYCEFVAALYDRDINLSRYIYSLVMNDENTYVHSVARKKDISPLMEKTLIQELTFLEKVSLLTSDELLKSLDYRGFLPQWEVSYYDFVKAYKEHLENLPKTGYGVFAKYRAFSIANDTLVPIRFPDPQRLDELIGYQMEREQVIKNTLAFLQGLDANNVLLYGDAGTGKSSTIKAVVNEYYPKGLRLIEVKKHQLNSMPVIMEQLMDNPLHFILFIDNLSFDSNDDSFIALKNILEGGVNHPQKNILVYATSNRRHFVKEDVNNRMGTELFVNDSIQETMSLAARFGLTITFQKPMKDLYLEIVGQLADRYGLKKDRKELLKEAEAFAIRSSGRSPRTAKQFIETVKINENIK